MTRLERIDEYLKKYGLISLEELPDDIDMDANFYPLEYLKLLENKLDDFTYKEDFSYLYGIFPRLSFFLSNDIEPLTDRQKRNIQDKLAIIHEKLQILLITKPGNIDKKEIGYQVLLKLINKVEELSLSYLYDFVEHYKDSHVDLLEYLVFDIKTYSLVDNAIKKFPYMVRFTDKDGILLIEKIIDKYLDECFNYTKDKELSLTTDLVYYDQIVDLFLSSPKIKIPMKLRIELIGKIENLKNNINNYDYNELTKNKYIFWLNNLLEKLENFEIKSDQEDFRILSYKHDIKYKFDEGILSEAKRLHKSFEIDKFKNREKILDEYIITIDGEDAEELDDSLSIKKLDNGNYLIGVHIADPGGYIPVNSIIMDEVLKRTTSIYLSDRTIPMIPEILSKDTLNLLENKERLATSYYMEVNKNGNIENFYFKKSIISVNKNDTYHNIDNYLTRGYADNEKLDKTLELLSIIIPKLSNNFSISELYLLMNRTTKNVSNTNITTNSSSAKIVETSMIMTNHLIAKFFWEQHLPFINRVHQIEPEYLEVLKEKEKLLHGYTDRDALQLIQFLEKSYPSAEYLVNATGHAGLGLEYYSHNTSPLRRSPDVLNTSICIDKIYFGKLPDYEIYKLEKLLEISCEYINARHPTISHFEKMYEKEKNKSLIKKRN